MTRAEIIAACESRCAEQRPTLSELERLRRIAGAKWKQEQREHAAKATLEQRAKRDRFMSGV